MLNLFIPSIPRCLASSFAWVGRLGCSSSLAVLAAAPNPCSVAYPMAISSHSISGSIILVARLLAFNRGPILDLCLNQIHGEPDKHVKARMVDLLNATPSII